MAVRRCRSNQSGSEVELSCPVGAALELARLIAQGRVTGLALDAPSSGAEPYDRWLDQIQVACSDESGVVVSAVGNALRIAGPTEGLALLARNIEALAQEPGSHRHLHLGFFEGHPFLIAGSTDLVVYILSS